MPEEPTDRPGADLPDPVPADSGEARHAAGPARRRRGGALGHSVLLGGRRRRGAERATSGQAGAGEAPDETPNEAPDQASDQASEETSSTVGAPTPSAAAGEAGDAGAADDAAKGGDAGESRDAPAASELTGRQRLFDALRRPGRGQIVIAVLLLVFGLGMVTQLREVHDDSTYANARRADLIQILDGLTNENRRLEGELGELQSTRTSLQSGADAQRVAREEASKRIEQLSILAGLVPVEGPGIRMVISDPNNAVTAQVLLDAIEELRDAGAEVIEINDSIRLVASSWFGQDSRGLIVDGMVVSKPIVIEAIGDPHSLTEGANFRGGIVSEIQSAKIGGSVQITSENTVEITSLHAEKKNQYARPASPQPS